MMQDRFQVLPDGTLVGNWKEPVNIAASAKGSIHNDETAQSLGLDGGWIAGSIHMEQLAPLLLKRFGPAWLRHGTLSVYFRNATVSGQKVRAYLGPITDGCDHAELRMEDEGNRIVCDGVAFLGEPDFVTPLRDRLARNVADRPGPLLSRVRIGKKIENVPSLIPKDRLARDLPGVTEPIDAYRAGALPANLAIDALRVVEPHLVDLPAEAVGLYGGIEIRMLNGPILAGVAYTCSGEVLALGRSPRTETLWYSSTLLRGRKPVARLLMLSRIMKPD